MEVKSENLKAKQAKLESWKSQNVYQERDSNGQLTISVSWVLKPKTVDGKISTKSRLCARGFEEIKKFENDSPTYSRESIRIVTSLMTSFKWNISSVSIKTAFLQ